MSARLSQQASAVEAAVRIFAGGMSPSRREKEHLAEHLRSAAETLRWVERHEVQVRAAIKAAREREAV